jgi:hypothetical protein
MAKPKNKTSLAKGTAKYPRQSLEKALRIPKAILDQNAGKDCSDEESATFCGMKYNTGPYATELSSSIKYGLLERPQPGRVAGGARRARGGREVTVYGTFCMAGSWVEWGPSRET